MLRIFVRPSDGQVMVDPADRAERERTLVLLDSPFTLVMAFFSRLLSAPAVALQVALDTLRRGLDWPPGAASSNPWRMFSKHREN